MLKQIIKETDVVSNSTKSHAVLDSSLAKFNRKHALSPVASLREPLTALLDSKSSKRSNLDQNEEILEEPNFNV